jgi:vacuolar-type H+-ATPase subunit D/Vma8
MAMWLPDGSLASKGRNIMAVFVPHFERVFSNHQPVDFNSILDLIPQREQLMESHQKCTRPSGRAHANADLPLRWPIL